MRHTRQSFPRAVASLIVVVLFASACAPAAPPSPTAVPAKAAQPTAAPKANAQPAPTAAPAKPAQSKPDGAAPTAAQPTAAPARSAATPPAAAKPAAKSDDFYAGKTIRILVGYPPGGNYDVWARVLSRHMGRHIPGNPNIIVENMPGAGSMVVTNHLYNVAPKDGTVFGTFGSGMVNNQLVKQQGVEFDMQQFSWLGAGSSTVNVCAVAEASGVTTFEEMLPPSREEVIFGSSGPGTNTHDYPLLMNALLNTNIKLVSGYPGNAQVRIAIESGEVNGYCLVWDAAKTQHQAWDQAGTPKYNYVLQLGFEKHPELQDVPNAYEAIQSEEDRAVIRPLIAADAFFFPFAAPPGLPAERVATLRQAFTAALNDPRLKEDAANSKLDMNPVTGERIDQLLKEILATPEPVVQRFKQLLGR